ncbi:MAG TPA: polysaccharide pyruvyl transferase family protein, partial [Gammaproteobacteria bacterium]
LVEVVGEQSKIRIAADFTNLVEGKVPTDFDPAKQRICIVPNQRMLDKTGKAESEAYLPFMINCTKYLLERGAKPFILLHEGAEDVVLAQRIAKAAGNIPILQEDDSLKIKGILGLCQGMLGSRFHGLVGALSQGVPALATGWSYKYQMLFEDYGFNEGLLDARAEMDEVKRKLNLIIDPVSRAGIKKTILERSAALKRSTENMWCQIFNVIES